MPVLLIAFRKTNCKQEILGLHPWRPENKASELHLPFLMLHSVVQSNVWSHLAFSPGSLRSKMVQVSSVYHRTAQPFSNAAGDFKLCGLDLHRELVNTNHRFLRG